MSSLLFFTVALMPKRAPEVTRKRRRRAKMSEINIVPYVDVTLVLLVIFMVTAPLLTQGFRVALPEANAPLITNQEEPLVVSVTKDGSYRINLGESREQPVTLAAVEQRVGTIVERNPDLPVLVWGDKSVPYGVVAALMSVLHKAGARELGLVTETPPAVP